MATWLPAAHLTCVAGVAMLLGCGAERSHGPRTSAAARQVEEPPTQGRAACLPPGDSHAGICGLAPPRRRVGKGTAYKLATVAGERFWVVLPEPAAGVVAVPTVPIGVNAEVMTVPARTAADRSCDAFPQCEPTIVARDLVASGSMARWDDASGTVRDLELTTVDLGMWTLAMLEPDPTRAERVARAQRWTVGEDGYPYVVSTDRRHPVHVDWAAVSLWARDRAGHEYVIDILRGCEGSTKQPDLGGVDVEPALQLHGPDMPRGGRWCVDGRYAADVTSAGRRRLDLLHQRLRVIPARAAAGGTGPNLRPAARRDSR